MSTRELACAALVLVAAGCAAPARVETPNLGRPATAAEIAGWDISVGPDGVGLPAGSGTALKGAAVYEQKCQACHGAKGAGQPNDRLAGRHGTLARTVARAQTCSKVPRGWPSMLRPSMRMSRVGPSRRGEWMSPSL